MSVSCNLRSFSACNNCIVRSIAFCSFSDRDLQVELERNVERRAFKAGDTIVQQGECSALVGSVIRGALMVQQTSRDGSQQIAGLLVAGDTFGRPFSQPEPYAIKAASDAILCCFSNGTLELLMTRYPELEHHLYLSCLDQLDTTRDWMIILGGQSVTERIASFFLFLGQRQDFLTAVPSMAGSCRYIDVPISRQVMAAFLGTTVESISRTVHLMADASIIKIHSSSRFEIRDRYRLIEMSGAEDLDFGQTRSLWTDTTRPGQNRQAAGRRSRA